MDSISTDYFMPNAPETWDNYDEACKAKGIKDKIQYLASFILMGTVIMNMSGISRTLNSNIVAFPNLFKITVITAIALPILAIKIIQKINKYDNVNSIFTNLSGLSYVMSLAKLDEIATFHQALPSLILHILSWSIYFFGSLHSKGLTNDKFYELRYKKINQIIKGDSPLTIGDLVESIEEKENLHLFFNPKINLNYNQAMDSLDIAYQNKKVVHFNFSIKKPYHFSESEMKKYALLRSDFKLPNSLFLTINYLIQCYKRNPDNLNLSLIAEQLDAINENLHAEVKLQIKNGDPILIAPKEWIDLIIPLLMEYFPKTKFDEIPTQISINDHPAISFSFVDVLFSILDIFNKIIESKIFLINFYNGRGFDRIV